MDKGKLKRFNSSASKMAKLKNTIIGKGTSCDTNRPDFSFAILYFIKKKLAPHLNDDWNNRLRLLENNLQHFQILKASKYTFG